MPLPGETRIHPRPGIEVGAFTIYNDFRNDPKEFQDNNVLYHYPMNHDRLVIGKFCSIACGAVFIMNGANHTLRSLSTYPFPLFGEAWDEPFTTQEAWDKRGDIVIGNDVGIGYEAAVLSGVRIGDGAIIGARAVVTKDVPPYTIVGGIPARPIRRRFDDATIERLLALRWWDWPVERIRRHLRDTRGEMSRRWATTKRPRAAASDRGGGDAAFPRPPSARHRLGHVIEHRRGIPLDRLARRQRAGPLIHAIPDKHIVQVVPPAFADEGFPLASDMP